MNSVTGRYVQVKYDFDYDFYNGFLCGCSRPDTVDSYNDADVDDYSTQVLPTHYTICPAFSAYFKLLKGQ